MFPIACFATRRPETGGNEMVFGTHRFETRPTETLENRGMIHPVRRRRNGYGDALG